MARRIYIKDGGLNTSPTIPPGYTALGSDSGFLKTKVVDTVSDIGGGAVGGFEDITYNDLYTKVVNEELTPGSWYRLTDYKSVNFLNGWDIASNNPTPTDPNFNPHEIYEGETEVLILQAISPYEIAKIGYSETFQGDIVQYEPFTNKIGIYFDVANGNTLPDSNTVSGFDLQWDGTNVYFDMPTGYPALYGHYFYLYCEFDDGVDSYYQDGQFEPLTPGISVCQFPYSFDGDYPKAVSRIKLENNGMKVILLDLVEDDYNNYITDTLYVDTIYALGDAYGWITRRTDTFRNINVPFDFRGRKYRRFEVDLSSINSSLGTGYYGIGDDFKGQGTTGNYQDFKVFDNENQPASDIEWGSVGGPDVYGSRGINDNNVFFGAFFSTKIENSFQNNTITESLYNDIRGALFGNVIGNINFFNNTIKYSFINNTIGLSFQNNTIEEYFESNVIRDYFQYNTIKFQVSSINFSSATHVYGSYDCEIFRGSNNIGYLSYFDGTITQYVAITA